MGKVNGNGGGKGKGSKEKTTYQLASARVTAAAKALDEATRAHANFAHYAHVFIPEMEKAADEVIAAAEAVKAEARKVVAARIEPTPTPAAPNGQAKK